MRMTIEKIKISNFKGIRELEVDFGAVTRISGMNGTGKTTIPDAFCWVLWNKDSRGNTPGSYDFHEKPLNEDGDEIHNLDTTVELDCRLDGQRFNLKRTQRENWVKKRGSEEAVFQGNTSTYWINDVETKLSDFKARIAQIASEEVFRLIGSLSAFNALDWKKRREQLIALSDLDVDAMLLQQEQYRPLADECGQRGIQVDNLRKVLQDQRRRTNDELKMIPVRIDEARKALPEFKPNEVRDAEYIVKDSLEDIERINGYIAEIKAQSGTAGYNDQILALETEVLSLQRTIADGYRTDMRKLEQERTIASDAYRRAADALSDTKRRLERDRKELEEAEAARDALRADYRSEYERKFIHPEIEGVCPACKQPLPEKMIQAAIDEACKSFDADKKARLLDIKKRGTDKAAEVKRLEESAARNESEIAKLEAQRLEIEAQKIALGFTLREPNDTEKESIRTQLSDMEGMAVELEALINSGTLSPEMEAELNQQIANLELSSLLLKATLDPLTEEEITRLKDELTRTEKKRVEIEAQIAGGGLPPEQVSDLNKEIDDLNSREVLIKATLGQLDKQEVAQYASQQLGVDYAELVKASGGRFTQEDVERGRITQEVYDEWRAEQTIIAENQLRDLRTEVEGGRENIPELIERRTAAQETQEQYGAMAGDNFNDERFLSGLETQRQTLLSKYMAGEISDEELFSGGMDIINKAREHQWSDLWGAPANFETMQPDQLFGKMTGGLFGTGLFGHWEADSSVNPFGSAFDEINRRISERDTNSDNAGSEATAYNAALNEQYQSEVRLIERENFAGFGVDSELSMASLGDLAAQYAELDEAGKQMFQNALEGLAQLNATADYITEEEKTSGQALIEQAQQSAVTPANTEVLGEIQEKLRGIAEEYSGLSGEEQEAFNAGNIEAVNAALDGLGLEKIESLSQINSVLTDIANIDPSGLNFDAAAASLEALGGDASSAREKVNAVKAELEQLEGTYTATIQVKQTGSASVSLPGGAVKQNAEGGIYDGAMLSWVAEDGPEAIIPLGAKRRERGLDLWLQAGKMLGVEEFAEGGIAAPYASLLGKMDDEPESKGGFAPSNGGGARVIEVSVSANPTYQITGEDSEGIMDKLRANAHELAELLAGELADEFEDIVTNMV